MKNLFPFLSRVSYTVSRIPSFGFSMIELIIVVFVVGFMILVIANIPSALSLVAGSRYQSIAREIVSTKIESIRSIGFENLADTASPFSDDRLSLLPQAGTNIVIEDCPVDICPYHATLPEKVTKRVKITINWQEQGKPKSFELSTLISKGGLK